MMVLLAVILFVIDFVLTGYGTVYLWNNIVSSIFGITTITFMQGYALSMVVAWWKGLLTNKKLNGAEEYTEHLASDIFVSLIWLGISWIFIHFI